MKAILTICCAAALSVAIVIPAIAQSYNANAPAELQKFLMSDPTLADELAKNPGLYDNQAFLDRHPHLTDFLKQHPNYWAVLKNQTTGQRFGQFLSAHPQIAAQVKKHPGLLTDPNYVNSHLQLREFLFTHPGVAYSIQRHPKKFTQWVESGDWKDDNWAAYQHHRAQEAAAPGIASDSEQREETAEVKEKHHGKSAEWLAHHKWVKHKHKKHRGQDEQGAQEQDGSD